jgi:hypothetical protein
LTERLFKNAFQLQKNFQQRKRERRERMSDRERREREVEIDQSNWLLSKRVVNLNVVFILLLHTE